MAIERPSIPDEVDKADLQRRLSEQLTVHQRRDHLGPTLTLVGFDATEGEVLDRGLVSPEAVLLGFALPMRYSALGVIASSVISTGQDRRHHDASLALAVSRSDDVVSLLATPDRITTTREPHGWLIDACRRAVGLATATNRISALEFPIALWLDRLMVAIVTSTQSGGLTWATAATLCPLPRRWHSTDPVDLGTTLGSTTRSWTAMRQATASGRSTPVEVEPEHAAWMDDAMFARWCMGSFPDLANLRADVEFLASPEVAENVEVTLRAAWLAFADERGDPGVEEAG